MRALQLDIHLEYPIPSIQYLWYGMPRFSSLKVSLKTRYHQGAALSLAAYVSRFLDLDIKS